MRRVHFLPTNSELTIHDTEAKAITITKAFSVVTINPLTFSSLALEVRKDSCITILHKPFSSYTPDSIIEDLIHINELIEDFKSITIKITSPDNSIDFFIEMLIETPDENTIYKK